MSKLSRERFGIRYLVLILTFVIVIAPSLSVSAQQTEQTATPPEHILAWVEDGPNPAESSPSAEGQIGLINSAGEVENLVPAPAQASRVMPCGDEATSPDGSMFAFYMGLDSGDLYTMSGGDAPLVVDNINALACLGGGTFQYSPDSSRMAYIAFEPDAASSEFADGFLHVVGTSGLSEEYSYQNVIAFDMNDEGVAFVSFFTNDQNEADEAAVLWWNGSAEREVATLKPDADCKYTSASIGIAPDGNLLLVLGHRCSSGNTQTSWQIQMIDVEARSATMAATEFQPGAFTPFAQTNNIVFSPDGETAFFTVPDGVVANTASILAVDLASLTTSIVVERQAVMPTLSGSPNAFPQISPDGRWWAMVVTSPNNENTLTVVDLGDPSAAPITISAGSTGDVIPSIAFSGDSQSLILIAGAGGGGREINNSLIMLDLASGSNVRVKRGRYAPGLAVSPDGTMVAAMDYQVLEDVKEPPYLNLIAVSVDSGETVTLSEGATITDGKVTDQRFAYPLTWRP